MARDAELGEPVRSRQKALGLEADERIFEAFETGEAPVERVQRRLV
jgi:hypothetical protein